MNLPTRKNNRLRDYDYSQNGVYFITMCTKDRRKLFWRTVGARIARPSAGLFALSPYGAMVDAAIQNISGVYPAILVDHYVVMPNHVHLLLRIDKGNAGRAMRAPTISTIVNQMKGVVTKEIGFSCWQKLFHDHVIRNQQDYERIWQYIDTNPAKWEQDCFYVSDAAENASSQ